MLNNSAYDKIFDVTQVAQAPSLKSLAATKDPNALKIAAKQFEAFFMDSMMQSMRGASKALGQANFLHSSSTDFFEEMYDQQLSLNLVRNGELGIAGMVQDELSGKHNVAHTTSVVQNLIHNVENKIAEAQKESSEAEVAEGSAVDGAMKALNSAFDDPVKFVKALWADAVEAAEKLDLDPKLLIAQAALETGWGKSIISGENGSSFNLFNIKADKSWLGDKIAKDTLEYEDGVAVKKKEPFRRYQSFAESFKDYTSFLNTNSRYNDALSMSYDPLLYLQSLQDAGYATDPKYANKVYEIYRGDTLTNAISTMFTR